MSTPSKKKRRAEPAAAADAAVPEAPVDTSGGGVGKDLIAKSTSGMTLGARGSTPGRRPHRRGHDSDEQVKSLAHLYSPWANIRANGSGIVALAAWAKRLEEEAAEGASSSIHDVASYVRGLTHR